MNSQLLHRTITVTDLDASVRFYEEGLGFAPLEKGSVPVNDATLPKADIVSARNIRVRNRAGITLDLVQYDDPPGFGSRERRPFGFFGYTHLAFYVEKIDAAAADVEAAGGKALRHTHARYDEVGVEMMYAADPDGVRVELMMGAGIAPAFSHSGICVDTIEAALPAFAAIGFTPEESFDFSEPLAWVAKITETEGMRQRVQMLRNRHRDTIELLEILHPGSRGIGQPPEPNRLGFGSITVAVDDVDLAAATLATLGGHFPDTLRTDTGGLPRRRGALPWDARLELVTLRP